MSARRWTSFRPCLPPPGRPVVYASVGVHPDSTDIAEPSREKLVELAGDPKVVAIGETGLDYYRLPEPLEWQRERFRDPYPRCACLRQTADHPHAAAAADTLRIMREEGAGRGRWRHALLHRIGPRSRAQAMELGFHISFSGIVTFKNAQELQATADVVPLDRLLIETDSPYLAPVPHRGKSNEPAYVPFVAAKLAELRGTRYRADRVATTDNFYRLFNALQR